MSATGCPEHELNAARRRDSPWARQAVPSRSMPRAPAAAVLGDVTPLSLYVHLPWCARKCPYCDFNSHQHDGAIPEVAYVRQLLADLDTELPYTGERALQSIFIGGGTPSLFAAAKMSR
jgi:oxygen-independent coproporphyrinogen-3 oxidase